MKSNLEDLEVSKMLFFAILGFGKYQPLKSANIHKNQNSEPLTVLKWQILDSKSTQL